MLGFSGAVVIGRFFSGVQQRTYHSGIQSTSSEDSPPLAKQYLTTIITDKKDISIREEDLCNVVQGKDAKLFLE